MVTAVFAAVANNLIFTCHLSLGLKSFSKDISLQLDGTVWYVPLDFCFHGLTLTSGFKSLK